MELTIIGICSAGGRVVSHLISNGKLSNVTYAIDDYHDIFTKCSADVHFQTDRVESYENLSGAIKNGYTENGISLMYGKVTGKIMKWTALYNKVSILYYIHEILHS